MRKFIETIGNKLNSIAIRTKTALANTRGESNFSTAISLLITLVIGALLLAGLYTLFDKTVLPTVTQKVNDLFNYKP